MTCTICANDATWFGTFEERPSNVVIWHHRLREPSGPAYSERLREFIMPIAEERYPRGYTLVDCRRGVAVAGVIV